MPTVKRTNDEWRALLAEQRASGQTQPEWCEAHGVNLFTLRDRASRLKKMDKASALEPTPEPKRAEPASVGWMEIKPESLPVGTADIRVEHGGFVVTVETGFDAELLIAVLQAVRASCC